MIKQDESSTKIKMDLCSFVYYFYNKTTEIIFVFSYIKVVPVEKTVCSFYPHYCNVKEAHFCGGLPNKYGSYIQGKSNFIHIQQINFQGCLSGNS